MHCKLLEARRERFREKLPEAILAFAKYYDLDPVSLPPANLFFRDLTVSEVKDVIRRSSSWSTRRDMPSDFSLRLMLAGSRLLGGSGIACHLFLTPNIHIPTLFSQVFLPSYAIVPILAHEYAHVIQNNTRALRLKHISITDEARIYLAAIEGLASRLNTTLMDEILEQGSLTNNDKMLGRFYRCGLRLSSLIFTPITTLKSLIRKLLRTFMLEQTVARLVDENPKLFGFLIDPYQDGNEFVARVEAKIGNKKEAFDLISYQPPSRAHELLDPEGYVDFWLADVRIRLRAETSDTVLSRGQIHP